MARNLDSHTRRFRAGHVLFEENDTGSRMYVIQTGRVKIYRSVGREEVVLAVLGPGDFLGEMALLEGLPRSATAQVVEDAKLIVVDGQTFADMVRGNTEIAVRIMRRLASRVRELDHRLHHLLADGGVGRVVEILRWLSPRGESDGDRVRLPAQLVRETIVNHSGITDTQVGALLDRLVSAKCLEIDDETMRVAGVEVLNDYSTYLDLKRKYEPARRAGIRPDKLRVDRLLKALEIDLDEIAAHQSVLASHYRRYLRLKARFEPEDLFGSS